MLNKVTISRMFAVAVVFGVLSGTSVHAGVKIEKAKTVLRTAAKVTALQCTAVGTVVSALAVANRGPICDVLGTVPAIAPVLSSFKFKAGVAVSTILCGVASYKLAKNLFKSYKNRNASTVAVNAAK